MTKKQVAQSDSELMLRVKKGEPGLMELLFKRYADQMYGYFIHHTGSKTDAQDLLQSLFERMLRYRTSYRGEAKFTTWMYQIAINLKTDYYLERHKSIAKLKLFKQELPENSQQENPQISPDASDLKRKILEEALSRMDETHREILILGKYERLRYKEIGRLLNCSEGAVKVRMHRALKELKTHCKQIAEELNYEI